MKSEIITLETAKKLYEYENLKKRINVTINVINKMYIPKEYKEELIKILKGESRNGKER